jgi:hypothetical protein
MLIRNYYLTAVRQISRSRFHTMVILIVAQTSKAALANPVNSLKAE